MSIPIKVLDPDYFRRFHCIGTECEDTCCDGMVIAIDKTTYNKYMALPSSGLKVIIDSAVTENALSASDSTYAQITSTGSLCPFLTQQRLCSIQLTLGEDYLSRTCSVYPRALSHVDGVLERTLYMSCPEAVRVALLNPDKMEFLESELDADRRFIDFPVLDSSAPGFNHKPYGCFGPIRQLIISVLQNRDYRVWERLVIVGLFCEQLDRLVNEYNDDAIPELIESYYGYLAADQCREPLAGITSQHGLQVQTVIEAMEYRIKTYPTGIRLIDSYSEFLQGIGHSAEMMPSVVADNYSASFVAFYEPYMADRQYILEHYVVNYVVRNLFPLGPQTSTYYAPKSIFDEFALLVIHYSLLRTLLVGISGYHRTHFGDAQIVKTIQSFAKDIEHNMAFLKRISGSLAESNMADMAHLAVLLKD